MPFFIAFLLVPLLELYVLMQVGEVIGALPTIGLCILTALLGAALLKHQGLQTLTRARANLDRGAVPALELFEALALALGGVLLMTPGLVTDVIGFACLIPYSRQWIVNGVLRRAHVRYGPVHGQQGPPAANDAIEGEYERRDRE